MELNQADSWRKQYDFSDNEDDQIEWIPDEYSIINSSQYRRSHFQNLSKKLEINHVPMFEWSINFTENKGIPIRPYRNMTFDTIHAKPYK